MPPGRKPIRTRVVREPQRADAYEEIRAEIKRGRQAYFILPLVQESEAEGFTDLKSVATESRVLAEKVFPEFRVGLLHGQMRSDEKSAIMSEFKAGRIHILVSTTVIEVGVDVPNATIIGIEHAERFGLSQLHQLRGRVGRGEHESFCYLLASRRGGDLAAERLHILETTTDGFKIAEADLEMRGPGEFLGTRQSGELPFRMANLVRDRDWLLKARNDALELLKTDPSLQNPPLRPLRRFFEKEGKIQFEWLKTS
jgi:ATP-dependent DNA helicase RecG